MDKFDVIIVGGGVIGRSIAFRLSDKRLRIALIDCHEMKYGKASLAAGGMLGAFGEITADKNTEMDCIELQFRISASKRYHTWLDELQKESEKDIYTKQGTFIVANRLGPDDQKNMKEIVRSLDIYKEKFQWVEPETIPNYKPDKDCAAYQAIFIENENSVNTADLYEALTRGIIRKGVCVIEEQVISLIMNGESKINGVVTNQRQIYSDRIILCAGVGIQDIVDQHETVKRVLPEIFSVKGSSMLVEYPKEFSHTIRTPNRAACGLHIVPRSRDTVYIGATHRNNLSKQSKHHKEHMTLDELQYLLDGALRQISSDLRGSNVLQSFYGHRPVTFDQFPIIGATKIDGLFVATGTYRNGILMAPLVADVIHAVIFGEDHPFKSTFSPAARHIQIQSLSKDTLIGVGVKHLLAFVKHNNGDSTRQESEVDEFIQTLVKMALSEEELYRQLVQEAKKAFSLKPDMVTLHRLYNKYVLLEKRKKHESNLSEGWR